MSGSGASTSSGVAFGAGGGKTLAPALSKGTGGKSTAPAMSEGAIAAAGRDFLHPPVPVPGRSVLDRPGAYRKVSVRLGFAHLALSTVLNAQHIFSAEA